MYATVRRYTGAPGFADALREREGEVLRLLRDISGFGAYYLIDGGGGVVVSVSVYDDEAGASESNSAAAAWIAETLPDLRVGAPEVTAGEVAIQG
jgi:hypothetical protein